MQVVTRRGVRSAKPTVTLLKANRAAAMQARHATPPRPAMQVNHVIIPAADHIHETMLSKVRAMRTDPARVSIVAVPVTAP